MMFDEAVKPFHWFLLPSKAADCLKGNQTPQNAAALPFCPPQLRESLGLPVFVGSHANGDCDVTDYVLSSGTETECHCKAKDKVGKNRNEIEAADEKSVENGFGNECKETERKVMLNQDSDLKNTSKVNAEKSYVCTFGKNVKNQSVDSCSDMSGKNNICVVGDVSQESLKNSERTDTIMCNKSKTGCDNVYTSCKATSLNEEFLTNSHDTNTPGDNISATSCGVSCDDVTCTKDDFAEQSDTCNTEVNDKKLNQKQTEMVIPCEVMKASNDGDSDMKIDEGPEAESESSDNSVNKDTRKRKNSSDNILSEEVAKKSKEKWDSKDSGKKGKRKDNSWFSPPKTIFTPFLKVS